MPGKGRMNGTERRSSDNMYVMDVTHGVTTIMEENRAKGWNKKDKPVGGEPKPALTAGSRGHES